MPKKTSHDIKTRGRARTSVAESLFLSTQGKRKPRRGNLDLCSTSRWKNNIKRAAKTTEATCWRQQGPDKHLKPSLKQQGGGKTSLEGEGAEGPALQALHAAAEGDAPTGEELQLDLTTDAPPEGQPKNKPAAPTGVSCLFRVVCEVLTRRFLQAEKVPTSKARRR